MATDDWPLRSSLRERETENSSNLNQRGSMAWEKEARGWLQCSFRIAMKLCNQESPAFIVFNKFARRLPFALAGEL
jgi:hypothetical protein